MIGSVELVELETLPGLHCYQLNKVMIFCTCDKPIEAALTSSQTRSTFLERTVTGYAGKPQIAPPTVNYVRHRQIHIPTSNQRLLFCHVTGGPQPRRVRHRVSHGRVPGRLLRPRCACKGLGSANGEEHYASQGPRQTGEADLWKPSFV